MEYKTEMDTWLGSGMVDEDTRKELLGIKDIEEEVRDRFCKHLEFGTAGLRGIMGAGTNRMNRYTVGRATQGLADYIASFGQTYKERGAVIAYDTRRKSKEFALETALVMAGNGIKAYLFEDVRPTPELSFAVRYLNAAAGVMITASHNPPEYNGYKVYWEDGGQIASERAEGITCMIDRIDNFSGVKAADRQTAISKGWLRYIGPEVDEEYINLVKELALNRKMIGNNGNSLGIIYTPLHGTGNMLVGRVLEETGFKRVDIVKEQAVRDPGFSTVKSPNPEDREALRLAMQYAGELDADIVIGSDPDCDRTGIAARDSKGEFVVLTGNQIGALMVEYILSQRKNLGLDTPGDTIIKTIVTSEIGRAIAESYGVRTVDTLTGFKYIGEKIEEYGKDRNRNFVFGYEESNGYLAGSFVRDKDGVIAAFLACEMALYYKLKGMTLVDVLENLYRKYGYFYESVKSIRFDGIDCMERAKGLMKHLRNDRKIESEVFGNGIDEVRDYLTENIINMKTGIRTGTGLPKSDVLYYRLVDETWLCIRPSGTEPKVKLYFAVRGTDREDALQRLKAVEQRVMDYLQPFLDD